MKIVKLTILLIVIISSSAFSQSITLFDVDASNFPIMQAKFYAFDEAGNQQRPSISELSITENGVEKTITNVSCPPAEPPRAISSVLTIDVSGSMQGDGLKMAREAARAWVEGLPLGKSECAITTFDDKNYLNQDFTRDRESLLSVINGLKAKGGTDYDAALLKLAAGGLQISRNARHKRVIVIITDGMPNQPPDVNRIISEAIVQNCVIYAVTLGMRCPENLKHISSYTKGEWFENVTTVEQARTVYQKILQTEQGGIPCTIEWESVARCKSEVINAVLNWNSSTSKSVYTLPLNAVMELIYEPAFIHFEEPEPGVWQSTIVRVKAIKGQFIVTDIEISNPSYDISPKSFTLNSGESIDLTLKYFSTDFRFTHCRFVLINEMCPSDFNARGGVPGIQPSERTIKLIHPNGGELFIAGSDTIVTWEGVPKEEKVKIEYRITDEEPWITIADSATGFSHPFKVPNINNNTYLARVTSRDYFNYCQVEIGSQNWMCQNLNVTRYRNGDLIPQVQNASEWSNLTTGAWCYYNNDPENGEIYGKLYNWYAVNDPRGLAPEGWRVASDDDWKELEMYLGMTQEQADSMAERGSPVGAALAGGNNLWPPGNLHSHHKFKSSGFSGFPGGYRHSNSVFINLRNCAIWWSSSEYPEDSNTRAYHRYIIYYSTMVVRGNPLKSNGFSVRCIRDE